MHEFDSIQIDGIAMVWVLTLFGHKFQRSSFDYTSMADRVFKNIEHKGSTLFIIGSTDDNVYAFTSHLTNTYPELKICGYRNGYFIDDDERNHAAEEIAAVNPDYIVVGMGAPRQEIFITKLRSVGWAGIAYTCGGFIHQTANRGKTYYPKLIDRLNLRWLYRIVDEPRLITRYLILYPIAAVSLTLDLIQYKRRGHQWDINS